jgi:hypothetical protein
MRADLQVVPFADAAAKKRRNWGITFSASGFAAFFFQLAWTWSDMKPNIFLACASWGIVVASVLAVFWTWAKWTVRLKVGVVVVVPLMLMIICRPWIAEQYRNQHAPAGSEFQKRQFVLADQLVQFCGQWPTNKEGWELKYYEFRKGYDFSDRIVTAYRGYRDRGLTMDVTWDSKLGEIEQSLYSPSRNRMDVREEIRAMAGDIKRIALEVKE